MEIGIGAGATYVASVKEDPPVERSGTGGSSPPQRRQQKQRKNAKAQVRPGQRRAAPSAVECPAQTRRDSVLTMGSTSKKIAVTLGV